MTEKDDMTSAAALLGRKGGQAKSESKTKSSSLNGKKGGRPRIKRDDQDPGVAIDGAEYNNSDR